MTTKSRRIPGRASAWWGAALLMTIAVVAIAGWVTRTAPRDVTAPSRAGAFDAFLPDDAGSGPIVPIKPATGLDARKVALGRRLFNDTRLSGNGSTACVTCHDLSQGGVDHLMHPEGPKGARGSINTLTVFNSSRNFTLTWNGRVRTLAQLIDMTVTSPRMLGSRWANVVARIKAVPDYLDAFGRIYAEGVSKNTITDALAEFDRSLVTPGSRFDQYLMGDTNALTPEERRGYELFKSYGCTSCHQGMNVGGNMFQVFGVMADYFADRGHVTRVDLGRFNVTGNELDRYVFRVPSLRNVAVTAPYFHDGTAPTLADAIDDMAKYQLGRPMPKEDQDDIVKFLMTLTGKYKGRTL